MVTLVPQMRGWWRSLHALWFKRSKSIK